MKDKIISGVIMVAGLGLALVGGSDAIRMAQSRNLNPLELRGSPFGEVLGMALQDPIHMAWHGGQGHDDVLKPGEDASAPEGEVCEVCGVVHDDDSGASVGVDLHSRQPMPVFLKGKVELLGKFIRQKNSPVKRGAAVRNYELARTKNLLQTAYDFDPTNYGNYNALNFFYVTNQRRGKESIGDGLALADDTIEACGKYKYDDPQDALTAASAAENKLVWMYATREKFPVSDLVETYDQFAYEVSNYQAVMIKAVETGRLKYYSAERLKEMETRFGTFAYALKGYKEKIDAMPRIFAE